VAYRRGIELLPLLAWRGVDLGEREALLAEETGLASRAAELALEAGRVEDAVEVLEQGRGVLWSQVFDMRSDLDVLRKDHPDHARRMEALRAAIDGGWQASQNGLAVS
jgi:hypothetical protein